ncbi:MULTISPECIES: SRPBCC family protein [Amycolatopsis]|uniref:Polyketide cyclase/dehydrase/lipid transport protein n=1 Tax=Amycolatopsis thermoflava TaxID=84480 RepID=A0A3N2GNE3_9PSEU|nr:SRPBCC family protein [Amycolatopsis thermoflava]ROS38154.1 polyketide cyclase/dehydrase/lipid transport protein [Amycolatopsis thermoflava]
MRINAYHFRDTWLLSAPVRSVFDAVTDVAGYPLWWPDVREVTRVDDDTAQLVCRAALPYVLVVRMRRAEQDPDRGRLRVHLTGDLEGSLAAVVLGRPGGTRLEITQRVLATKPLLRTFSPLARPVFRANHALMMRRGRRGLQHHLSAAGAR